MTIFRLLLLAGSLIAAAAPLRASEVETARMTWVEIRDAVQAGKTTIIIPTGGTEQNGPHMVTGKHNTIVATTARDIAVALGDALVAPVLAYTPEGDIGTREGHMAYPGTISIPPGVFENVLVAAGESFAAHGFKTIVFLGDSGPNQAPQRAAAEALSQSFSGQGVRCFSADRYYGDNGQQALLVGEGESEAAIGTHAGIRDTSELMAVAPEGIRADKFAADKDGVSGDPERATVERGRALLALKVKAAVDEIKAARAAGPSPPGGDGIFARAWRWLFG